MALMVLGSVVPAKGGGDPATRSFFGPDSILDLELRFEFDSLMSDVREDPSYYPAILVYNDPEDHGRIEMNIRVRARGSFRRKPENCDFPPLKFKFDKEDRQGTLFENLKELKVVTHCQNDHMEFDQFVLQEFLIYRAYNLFTEFSFRVRLARITYVDLYGNADPITRMAFLIEDAEDMAERNHADLLDLKTVSSTQLNQDIFALMAMFNYMMLNTDYSVPLLHNIALVSTDYFEPPVPVPFDFDWSGMINIPYD